MIKKRLATIMIIVLFIAGLSLMLYPSLSDYLKTLAFQRAINQYRTAVAEIDEDTYDEVLAAAREYNEKLAARGKLKTRLTAEELAEYESLLSVTDTGVIGYVEIKKLGTSLPIYHGTSDAVLQSGIGHLEGSSLPIGGESTHAVLSGHRGLPSAQLFTNIDRLVVGDVFTVRVLKETLTYEVDQILTRLPYQTEALNIVQGEDYCTLLTCTPYGVNTHRLLVRGCRIETPPEDLVEAPAASPLEQLQKNHLPIIVAIAALALVLLVIIVVVLLRRRARRDRGEKERTE